MIWFIISIIVISVASFFFAAINLDSDPASIIFFMILSVLGVVLLIMFANTPTAMDVYQGKTTLEITYKDGVPIDSSVVYKVKEEK